MSLYVAARLGQPAINLMPRRLLPDFAAPSGAETIGARAECLHIVKKNGSGARGRVTWIEHLGDQNHLHVRVDQQELVALVNPDTDFIVGDEVGVDFANPMFFDRDGLRLAR